MLHCFDPIRTLSFWAILVRLSLAVVCGGVIGAEADEDVRAEAGWAALVRALDTDNAAADERAGQTHEHGKRRHVAQAVKNR